MSENIFCTIFTPAYNREKYIPRLYESLRKQTCKDFEWVVVDDGSTDNTEQIFNNILKNNKEFNVIYKKVENGGKHRAINKGLDLAKGKMFFIVDSDDYITEDAISKIKEWENTLNNSKLKFGGLGFLKGFDDKTITGKTFNNKQYVDATSAERKKYNILGDKAEVFYTNVLKEHKFPEIEGEKFMPETVVWYKLSQEGYKLRWINQIIYIAEYLEDGLTSDGMKIYINNPKGYLLNTQITLETVKLSFVEKYGLYYNYYKNMVSEKYTIQDISNDLKIKVKDIKLAIFMKRVKDMLKK